MSDPVESPEFPESPDTSSSDTSSSQESLENSPEFKDVPLPPPTITSLIRGLSSQAMISMGVFSPPGMEQGGMMLHQAKHFIDMIALVLEKTKGNLSDEEFKTVDSVLHELRMIFVAAQNEKKRREESKI